MSFLNDLTVGFEKGFQKIVDTSSEAIEIGKLNSELAGLKKRKDKILADLGRRVLVILEDQKKLKRGEVEDLIKKVKRVEAAIEEVNEKIQNVGKKEPSADDLSGGTTMTSNPVRKEDLVEELDATDDESTSESSSSSVEEGDINISPLPKMVDVQE